uniref:K Homology domain-containing protein n=1 Tax=Meloidogyne incognita TaxID=6306 RepID=A0A914NTZ6_MELIC
MGVKGRRVALIEELSNTVISFQKVDPKCQSRQLTIIAEAQNAIENAKSLIAETIERNISPNRKAFKHEEDKIISIPPGDKKNKMINKEQFKIIRENEGSLKIASNDAALLNVCLIIYVTYFLN